MVKMIGHKTLEELGIPAIFPTNVWEAMEVMKKLEEIGLIERKCYDILHPFERRYFPNQ